MAVEFSAHGEGRDAREVTIRLGNTFKRPNDFWISRSYGWRFGYWRFYGFYVQWTLGSRRAAFALMMKRYSATQEGQPK